MTRNEILPCPFCDNLGVTCYEGSTFRWVFAECDVCGARSGEVRKDTLSKDCEAAQAGAESDAITAWNTRPLRDVGVTDNAKQAHIDRLMMEYCPLEMTDEQVKEWGRRQRRCMPEENDAIAAALSPKAAPSGDEE